MPDPPRAPGNLPAELTSFVGRRSELAETRRLLTAARLVTLTGPGGVGKTRLALRAGAGLRRAFPDGVWLVRLEELTDPALLPAAITAAFGLTGEAGHLRGLVDHFAGKRLLLVLDNCDQFVPECATLAAKLLSATAGVRILATSRQILRTDGEQVLTVPPLPLPGESGASESLQLFGDRAAAVLPAFRLDEENRGVVGQICARLDGIPLAIELAAVRVRVLSPEQILQRLENRFHLLTTGSRTALPRRRTLEAAVDWSYELCTTEERALWRAVSVLPAGFDLTGAEAVCSAEGIAAGDVLDLVASLVDKSILVLRTKANGRGAWYGMLETVREYGWLRLVATGRTDAVRNRHAARVASLAHRYEREAFGPDQRDWVARLSREDDNIRTALEFCLGEGGQPLRAGAIAAGLSGFWYVSGGLAEGQKWLEAALSAAPESSGHALAAGVFAASLVGDTEAAHTRVSALRAVAERDDDITLWAMYAFSSGLARFVDGDLVGGRARLERALEGVRRLGCASGECVTLVLLAVVLFCLGDRTGIQYAEEALSLSEAHSAEWSQGYAWWAVGIHAWRRGDRRRSSAALRAAIGLRLGDRALLALTVRALAWCEAADGRYDRVAGLLGAADAVSGRTGTRTADAAPGADVTERCVADARRALGSRAYEVSYAVQAQATDDEVVSFALAEKTVTPRVLPILRGGARGGLTPREREIAGLVAEGLSNREIAARLVIAQRTAETHVENILAKLGFTSRAQIAAWLAENVFPPAGNLSRPR